MDLNKIKSSVELVQRIQKEKRLAAKAAEMALLWDFVSDIAETGDASQKEKANYLLESGIRTINNGKINLEGVATKVKESFDKLKKAAEDGTLEIEKVNGKFTFKAGSLTIKLDEDEIYQVPKSVKELLKNY